MPTSEHAPQAAAAPAGAPTSADRLIAAIESINDVDVANSPEPDRAAVLELIDIINDEQRSSLLFALLLERIRTGA